MIEVKLFDAATSQDPIRSLYLAYRVAYSALSPIELDKRIDEDRITRQTMLAFIEARLETGHASPLQQVYFEFGISGISRACSHQFVRHHVGLDLEQQSQRYVEFKDATFPYSLTATIRKAGMTDEYTAHMVGVGEFYGRLLVKGVPGEDARFVLPNATNTNIKCTVNFLELLHMADLRLCTRAQWEFRKVMAMMRAEIMRRWPELGRYIQPKCGESRIGYCDESYEAWQACPLGAKRPHKKDLFALFKDSAINYHHRATVEALDQADYAVIEET